MARRGYAWLLVALLWVVALLNYVDRQVIYALFPLLEKDFGLSGAQLGLLSTVFLWVYAFASPFGGYLADRFGRTRMILASLLVWSAVTWATGHAKSYGQLLAMRALMGFSEAFYIPAALALIADHHSERTRSTATGLHQSGLYTGIVLGGVVGGWLGERYGWRMPFTILGAIGVVYFAVLLAGLRPARRSGGALPRLDFAGSFRELSALPGFWRLTVVFSIVGLANWLVYTWMPSYLYERFGMGLALAGFSATFYIQAASFAGILAGGLVADAWAVRHSRGRIRVQAAGLAAAAPFLFAVGSTDWRPALLLGLILFGLGRGIYDSNAMPVLCQIAPPHLRSTGYGIFNLLSCVVGGLAAAGAGWLRSVLGLGAAFQIAAVLLLLGGWLLATTRITRERS
jgi:MFS family permease